MPNTTIQIKRSGVTSVPPNGTLSAGEQAYSYVSNTLFIGGFDNNSSIPIGGKYWIDISNSAFNQANAAFNAANNAVTDYSPAFIQANISFEQANTARDTANAAFNAANNAVTDYSPAFIQANAGFDQANTARTHANTAHESANAGLLQANTARDTANAAFTQANTARDTANTKFSSSGGTITGDVSIVGNLNLSGNTSLINVSTLSVTDPLLYLAANNYLSDIVDIGFVANYVNSTGSNVHTGLYREHTTKEYYLFQEYNKEPENNHIDPNANGFTISVLNADIRTSNLNLAGTNAVIWIKNSYDQANTARDNANIAFAHANAAFLKANSIVPGGLNTQLQYNSAGTFAGTSGITTDGNSLTITGTTNPTFPTLSLAAGADITGATLSGVAITGTAGQFSCTSTTLSVGQFVTISGTFGGTGSISGYTDSTIYRISATNGTTTFTLVSVFGVALVTTAGTPTGLTYTLGSGTNPTAFPTLQINAGSNITGTTLSGVQITGTSGQFSCSATTLSVGQLVTISGTLGGTGTITGYANPTTYRISATNGSTTFTLVNNLTGGGNGITTTAGTPTGLTYTVTSPGIDLTQTWNNSSVAFTGLRYNAVDLASSTDSMLMDLQTQGNSKFRITREGVLHLNPTNSSNVFIHAGNAGSRNLWFLATQTYLLSQVGFTGKASTYFAWNQNDTATFFPDLILTRRAAASLRLGAADTSASATVTVTIASPGVVSWSNHGLSTGTPVIFTTTGALPTGITAGTTYYVIFVSDSTFQIATTLANALSGTAINTSGTQSGTHTGNRWAITQRLSVQGVTGVTDRIGSDFFIQGSQGTGTGAGGSIIFQVAPAGGSGTAQNSLATALTIASDRNVTIGAVNGTGLIVGLGGGVLQDSTNILRIASATELRVQTADFRVLRDALIGWSLSNTQIFQPSDLILTRRAAASLRLGAADAAGSSIAISSVASNQLTLASAHGLTTGNIIIITGTTAPSGTSLNTVYYVRVISAQVIELYTIYAQAAAASGTTGRVAVTTAGTSAFINFSTPSQTLGVQDFTGTDIPGQNFLITGSRGTGTGRGGSIVFLVADSGSTGTAQNALQTAMEVTSRGVIITQPNVNRYTLRVIGGGGTGIAEIGSTTASMIFTETLGAYIATVTNYPLQFGNVGNGSLTLVGGTVNPIFIVSSFNIVEQHNTNNGQTFRVYGRRTDSTNDFERFFITAPTTSGAAVQLGTQKGATTGAARALELQTDSTTRMTIDATGNVGIGITSPTSNLHVIGNANVSSNIRVGGFVSFDNDDFVRINEPAANTFVINTASTERLRVDATGNVGIGITSPTSNLHVIGTANITSNLVVQGLDVNATTKAAFDTANAALRDVRTITYTIDGGGGPISLGLAGIGTQLSFNGTIQSVTALADRTGNCAVDIWKGTYNSYPFSNANTITANTYVTVNNATKNVYSTLSGWANTANSDDIFQFTVISNDVIEKLALIIKIQKA